jgi:hypothetical protein
VVGGADGVMGGWGLRGVLGRVNGLGTGVVPSLFGGGGCLLSGPEVARPAVGG